MGERELLFSITRKDLVIQTFRAGGKGGQNQNKRDTGVRIQHPASGAVGEARDTRSQLENRKAALERLVAHPKFRFWQAKTVWEIVNKKTIDQVVAEMMEPENLRVEVRDEAGHWVQWGEK